MFSKCSGQHDGLSAMQATAPDATSHLSFKAHEFRLQLNLAEFFKPSFSSSAGKSLAYLFLCLLLKNFLWALITLHSYPFTIPPPEIFLLTFLFCPFVSQAVSLHWFIPSHNTKFRSLLAMPCDFSVHSPSHQQLAHNEAKLLSIMSLEVVLKKHPQLSLW